MKSIHQDDDYVIIKLPHIFVKTLPLWIVILLILNSSVFIGLSEYYLMKKYYEQKITQIVEESKSPEDLVRELKAEIVPQEGYELGVVWKDIGTKLLSSGVIDKNKFDELFAEDPGKEDFMKDLTMASQNHMHINESNARFMVNTLWAFGLVNKSTILEEGSMKTEGEGNVMNYASTGGWDLGTKETSVLYSSTEIVPLSTTQVERVEKIARTVYRPCCNNHTEFPDCNHGMAALGYIELAVSQGLNDKTIYKDLLALNSFWFPQNYVDLAYYLTLHESSFEKTEPKKLLSMEYSSATGTQRIKQSLPSVNGLTPQGGGCST